MVEPLRVVLLRMCEFGYNLTIRFLTEFWDFRGLSWNWVLSFLGVYLFFHFSFFEKSLGVYLMEF